MSDPLPPPPSFSPARRWAIAFNVALSIVALAAVVLMVNYLAGRHFKRFLWTSDARYQLSEQTRRVLASVTNDLRVTILFDRKQPIFDAVAGLLKEYADACPHLTLDQVDYKRDLGRAEAVITRYQLAQTEADLVIFDSGGRSKVVRAGELSDYNLAELFAGEKEVKRIAFRGEPRFTDAIAGLVEARSPIAYFLQGHGEHDPRSDDPKDGYLEFARLLQQKNVTVSPLYLTGNNAVPADCQLLIIAGPRNRLPASEVDRIGRYLSQGGRLFVLANWMRAGNGPTGLERLLADWGVVLGDNFVFDPKNARSGSDVVATNFTSHPAVKALAGKSVYLLLPRSVDPARNANPGGDTPRVSPLILTSPGGQTVSDASPDGVPKPNPLRDRTGVIPVAVAAEKGSLQGVSADRSSTRLIVVGESLFLANLAFGSDANLDFTNLAVNWLLDRPENLSGIAPRLIQEYRIALTTSQQTQVRWLLLGLLPGTTMAIGWLVWFRRRR